jgi:3-hydroxyacyl-[acyl-carrier-protein] dehydratase
MEGNMDIKEVQRYLPHRYPFLMVDRVLEYEPNKRIVAIKNVTINEPVFVGHFPIQPVFPGVLIVEALAQTAGILAFRSLDRTPEDGSAYYLAGTDKTKFRRAVIPGDQLQLEVTIIRLRNQWMKAEGLATVDGETVCSTLLTCAEQAVG